MIKTKYGNAIKNGAGHLVVSNGEYRQKRLHRLIYEDYHKIKIPNNYDIHHIDEDKTNNDINNLVLMTHEEHTLHHKKRDEWRVIKKGVDSNGEQLYSLYSPDGKKVKTSTNKDRLERSKERRIKNETNDIKEKPKHSIVFDKYYELGDKRTLTELSDKTGYNISTLSKWKNSFNWEEKIENRDKGQLQLIEDNRLKANQEARAVYQDTIREIMKQQVITPLLNGTLDIEVKNISDIKKLIELDNLLSNEDKLDNKENELSNQDKDVINLIENDANVWEMLTNKLRDGDNDG